MHILTEPFRSALTVPNSTARLLCSRFEQTVQPCKNPHFSVGEKA
jgi:hypothetical protein